MRLRIYFVFFSLFATQTIAGPLLEFATAGNWRGMHAFLGDDTAMLVVPQSELNAAMVLLLKGTEFPALVIKILDQLLGRGADPKPIKDSLDSRRLAKQVDPSNAGLLILATKHNAELLKVIIAGSLSNQEYMEELSRLVSAVDLEYMREPLVCADVEFQPVEEDRQTAFSVIVDAAHARDMQRTLNLGRAFYAAARSGRSKLAMSLLKRRANPNYVPANEPGVVRHPLVMAAALGDGELTEAILHHGAILGTSTWRQIYALGNTTGCSDRRHENWLRVLQVIVEHAIKVERVHQARAVLFVKQEINPLTQIVALVSAYLESAHLQEQPLPPDLILMARVRDRRTGESSSTRSRSATMPTRGRLKLVPGVSSHARVASGPF